MTQEPSIEEVERAIVGLARMMRRHEDLLKRGDVWGDCISALRRLQAFAIDDDAALRSELASIVEADEHD